MKPAPGDFLEFLPPLKNSQFHKAFKEYLITLKNICFLLKFQGRPLVRRVKGGFVKMAFPKE